LLPDNYLSDPEAQTAPTQTAKKVTSCFRCPTIRPNPNRRVHSAPRFFPRFCSFRLSTLFPTLLCTLLLSISSKNSELCTSLHCNFLIPLPLIIVAICSSNPPGSSPSLETSTLATTTVSDLPLSPEPLEAAVLNEHILTNTSTSLFNTCLPTFQRLPRNCSGTPQSSTSTQVQSPPTPQRRDWPRRHRSRQDNSSFLSTPKPNHSGQVICPVFVL